jgi:hypothetical protein
MRPKCGTKKDNSADQIVAGLTSATSGWAVFSPALITIFMLPWALPAFAASLGYLALRKVTCKSCGARFNIFQERK